MSNNADNEKGPLFGELAPDFETLIAGHTIKLSDFRGKWVIIFSHPRDLLPVFRTRTVQYLLCKRRTKVIGLGNSQTEGIETGRNLLKKYILKHSLTILDDSAGEIAKSYGLLATGNEGLKEAKGVFIVDPKGVLRAKLFLPLSAERNFYEVLKLIDALQTADKQKMRCADKKTVKLEKAIKQMVAPEEAGTG
jgi:peroxiredoxin (alkyl hydroperoxide reductase subunit C)